MALRELLALFSVEVSGGEKIQQVDVSLDAASQRAADFAERTRDLGAATGEAGDGADGLSGVVDALGASLDGAADAASSAAGATEGLASGTDAAGAAMDGAGGAADALSGSLDTAGSSAEGFGFRVIESGDALEQAGGAAEGFASTLEILKAALPIAALGAVAWALSGFVRELTEAVDSTGKLSTAINVSTDAIQRWEAQAITSGGSAQTVATAFRSLARQQQEAAEGTQTAVDIFQTLGVDAVDPLTGKMRELEPLLIDVAAALAAQEDQGTKLSLAQDLLGRGALQLLPGFKASREEMEAQLESMGELAGLYSEDFIRASEAANDELFFMSNQMGVLKSQIVMAVLPAFRFVVTGIMGMVQGVREFLVETGLLDRWIRVGGIGALIALIKAGTVGLAGWVFNWRTLATWLGRVWALLRPFLPAILKFVAWALILDDIVTFLQGGDSALGRLLDKVFGAGAAASTLAVLRGEFALMKDLIWAGGDALDAFNQSLERGDGLFVALAEAGSAWGASFAESVAEHVTGPLAEVYDWLLKIADKLTFGSLGDALQGSADTIFDAEDARLNAEAIARAAGLPGFPEGAAAGGASMPTAPPAAGGGASYYTDNRRAEVNLTGPQTPETVRTAASEARKTVGDRHTANSRVRGRR